MKPSALSFVAACTWLCLSLAVHAQEQATGAVVGQGDAKLERAPEVLRMEVALTGQGKTVKEALAKVKARQQEARTKLEQLGADPQSIKFGEPAISTSRNDNEERMRQMFLQRMRSKLGPRGAEKVKLPDPKTVTVTLKAEWPLKAENAEALLLRGHDLQDKIAAADLAGMANATKEVSPEEQELAEEFQSFAEDRMGQSEEAKPGAPSFVFVSKISEEEHAKLLAQAFERAKAKAARLAAATGARLGELKTVSETSAGFDAEEMSNPYQYRAYQRLAQRAAGGDSDGPPEAVGTQPGKVQYHVMVSASFGLKTGPSPK